MPALVRWPGKIKAGEVSQRIFSGLDWFPTLLAAAGDTTVKDRLLKGWQPAGSDITFKNHLDGYNQFDYLTGKTDKSARNEFYYFNDDGDLVAMRYGDWKLVFGEQRAPGGFAVWSNPFTTLRVPKMFNLRMDPYERADVVSDQYYDWLVEERLHHHRWHAQGRRTSSKHSWTIRRASARRASASIRSAQAWTRRSTSPSRSAVLKNRASRCGERNLEHRWN